MDRRGRRRGGQGGIHIVAGKIKAGTAAAQRIIVRGRSRGVDRIRFIQYGSSPGKWIRMGPPADGLAIRVHGDAPIE